MIMEFLYNHLLSTATILSILFLLAIALKKRIFSIFISLIVILLGISFSFSTLLMIEFVLLLKKKWVKPVSVISIATVLYLVGEYFEIFHLLDYIENRYFKGKAWPSP